MKRCLLACLVIVVAILATAPGNAMEQYGQNGHKILLTIEFPAPALRPLTGLPLSPDDISCLPPGVQAEVLKNPVYHAIEMPDTFPLGALGEPVLPARCVKVLIPYGEETTDIRITSLGKTPVPGTYVIVPGQKQVPISQLQNPDQPRQFTPPRADIYGAAATYPAQVSADVQTQWKKGYRILALNICPVEYTPQTGSLASHRGFTIEITTSKSPQITSEHQFYKATEGEKPEIKRIVDNAEALATYPAQRPAIISPESHVSPLASHKYVIITNDALKNASGTYTFQDLLAHRQARGLTGTIVTTEFIYANYNGTRPDGGSDNQTRIRNFIIDAYTNWGTEYVLLGGDGDGGDVGGESGDDIVPARGFYVNAGGEIDYNIPADLYYACLDGSFDYDADGWYGEPADGPGGGAVDLLAEVTVGRAAVDSDAEVSEFVRKTITYEDTIFSDEPFNKTALMVGEDLGWAVWGGDYKDEIRDGSSNWGYTTVGFPGEWTVDTLYDRDSVWAKSQLIAHMNNDTYHAYNHLGHANVTYVMKMVNADVDALTNTKYFLAYSQGCYDGAFDNRNTSGNYLSSDCILEHFTTTQHGAFAFIGNSRYGWGHYSDTNGASQHFDREFWDAIFGEDIKCIAKAHQDSKEDSIGFISGNSYVRWCAYEFNLFGDPFTSFGGGVSSQGSVFFDKDAYSDGQMIQITLMDNDLNTSTVLDVYTDQVIITTTGGDNESMITLTETGTDTAIFMGSILLSDSAVVTQNGIVEAGHGETITIRYNDADDGSGNPAVATDTATVDNQAPVISNVQTTAVTPQTATIEWDTDEQSSSGVFYGQTTALGLSTVDELLATTHSVVLSGLTPDTTYYYDVASTDSAGNAAYDDNGGGHYQFTTLHGAEIDVSPTSFDVTIDEGESTTRTLTISNLGDQSLVFDIDEEDTTPIVSLPDFIAAESSVSIPLDVSNLTAFEELLAQKYEEESIPGPPVELGSGGPDTYGYRWIDSDESGGPAFDWIDITGTGVQITGISDDTNVGPFSIGFDFPLYGNTFTTFRFCTNGWISFSSGATSYSNLCLPSPSAPENLIAPFWDDLNFNTGGSAYYWSNGVDTLIISYIGVPHYGGGGPYTFQVILHASGTILFQYQSMGSPIYSATVGIQNADGSDGLEMCCNASYIHNNLAICISHGVDWLTEDPVGGTVAASSSQDVTLTFDATGLASGTYTVNLVINNNDLDEDPTVIPAALHVLGAPKLNYSNYAIDDDTSGASNGDNDAEPEPGETVEISVALYNSGHLDATGVTGTLSLATSDAWVTIIDSSANWPDIPVAGTRWSSDAFAVSFDPLTPEGHQVSFDLSVDATNGGPWVFHDAIQLTISTVYCVSGTVRETNSGQGMPNIQICATAPASFSDDMESGPGTWTHSGTLDEWEHGTATFGPSGAHSGTKLWATDLDNTYEHGGATDTDCVLVSEPVDLTSATNPMLTFWHWYDIFTDTSDYDDGGYVEVSTNGGSTWTQIFPVGGYPHYLDADGGSLPCYAGLTSNWEQAQFDLSSYAGSVVYIRFHFWAEGDEGTPGAGWYIDDVEVSGASVSFCTYTTDTSGSYTLCGLPAGTYNVSPASDLCYEAPTPQSITVPPDASSVNFTLNSPEIAVSPADFSSPPIQVCEGGIHTETMRISNTGSADLAFSISNEEWYTSPTIALIKVKPRSTSDQPQFTNPPFIDTGTPRYAPEGTTREAPPSAEEITRAVLGSLEGGVVPLAEPIDVIMVCADQDPTEIKSYLSAYPDIGLLDYFDGRSGTPSLSLLQNYHVALVMSNGPWADPVAIGDVLANYVDAGGAVVITVASFDTGGGWEVRGRFKNENYGAFNHGTGLFATGSLGTYDASHPIMAGVSSVTDYYRVGVSLATSAVWVADWNDSYPYVATKGDKVASVNGFIVNGSVWTDDMPIVIHNAIIWAAGVGLTWLSEVPDADTILAGSYEDIEIVINADGVAPGDYGAYIVITSNDCDEPEIYVPIAMHVEASPHPVYDHHITDDDTNGESSGDSDAYPEPGETVEMPVWLTNNGSLDATGIQANLSTTDTYITISDSHETWPTIPSDQTRACLDDFTLDISPTCPTPHEVDFQLTLSGDAACTWPIQTFSMTVVNASSIEGTVYDLCSALPLDGATVHYSGATTQSTVVSQASGLYHIDGLISADTLTLYASKTGYVDSNPTVVSVPPDRTAVDLSLGYSQIDASPSSLPTMYLAEGTTDTQPLTLTNLGCQDLVYTIRDRDTTTSTLGAALASAVTIQRKLPPRDFTKIQPGVEYAPGELLARFREGTSRQTIDNINLSLGTTVLEFFRLSQVYHIQLPDDLSVEQALVLYNQNPAVEYAEPNYRVNADQIIPNDPNFNLLWGMHNTGQTGGTPDADIDAPEAWSIQQGRPDIIVAVIDTGVDYNHVDLAANIWTNPGEIPGNSIDDDGNGFVDDYYGWDFAYNDNDPWDGNSHGTHCAGTIGAVGNNGIGVAGVNWTVDIMAVKFLSDSGSGWTDDAIEAVEYATLMGARVMSNSWGGGGYSQGLYDAIVAADAAGALFIAAAGNDGTNNDSSPHYPCNYDVPNVISVAATTHTDQKASFSNYGATTVDLGAPGVNIYSTTPNNTYGNKSGTSMATPHVSGAAALMWAANSLLSNDEVKAIIFGGVDPIPALSGITVTGGRLNLDNSLYLVGAPWLSEVPESGTAAPSAADQIDIVYDASGMTPGTYSADVIITANAINSPVTVGAVMVVVAAPVLSIDDLTIDDSSLGDGDGYPEAGETVEISISLTNTGSISAQGVSGMLVTGDSYVTLTDASANWADIGSGSTLWSSDSFAVQIDPATPAGHIVHLTLSVTATNGGPWVFPDAVELSISTLHCVSGRVTETNTGQGVEGVEIIASGYLSMLQKVRAEDAEHMASIPVTSSIEIHEVSTPEKKPDVADYATASVQPFGSGGPDTFGYLWIDSDEPGGPSYNWVDITGTGTQIAGLGDDTNVGPFSIGFDFPFYGSTYNSFRFCTNGFIVLDTSYLGAPYSNQSIPSSSVPPCFIAPFWDDLSFSGGGSAYYWSNGIDTCIVSYVNVPHYSSGGPYTFQIILTAQGTITYQYQTMNTPTDSATVGIQNSDGSDGLQVVYSSSYIHNALAVRIGATTEFSTYTNSAGYYNLCGLPAGTYEVSPASGACYLYSSGAITVTLPPDAQNVDFSLTSPELEIAPSDLADPPVDVLLGTVLSLPVTISNVGSASLHFEIFERTSETLNLYKVQTPAAAPPKCLGLSADYDPDARTSWGKIREALAFAAPLVPGDVLDSWLSPSPISYTWGVGYDGSEVWVADPNTIWDYEVSTDGVLTGVDFSASFGGSWSGDFAWDGSALWQVNVGGDNKIYQINPTNGAILGSIGDPAGIWTSVSQRGLAYDRATDTFYIGGWNQDTVYHIQGLSGASPGSIISQFAFSDIAGLAWHQMGSLWIVTNNASDTIYQVDPSDGSIVQSFALPGNNSYGGCGLAIDRNGNLWAGNQNENKVYLIDSGVPYDLVPWLSYDRESGDVPVTSSTIVTLYLDATGLPEGLYNDAYLKTLTNDCDENPFILPVAMNIITEDINGPIIGSPDYLLTSPSEHPIVVTAEISDLLRGNSGVGSATLYYGFTSPYNQGNVAGAGPGGNGDGTWTFTIPSQSSSHEGDTLRFYIVASDDDDTPATTVQDNEGAFFPTLIGDNDTAGPTVQTPSYSSAVPVDVAIQITALISDASTGNSGITSATLSYGYSTPYNQNTVVGTGPGGNGDGTYTFSIPGQTVDHAGQELCFFIQAWDADDSPAATTQDNAASFYSIHIQTEAALHILSIVTAPTEVACGEQDIPVDMSISNTGENGATITSATVTFWYGMANRDSDYTVTPDAGNPTTLAGGGSTLLHFLVNVSASAALGEVTLDGSISGAGLLNGHVTSDPSADTTDSWTVTPAPTQTVIILPGQSLVTGVGVTGTPNEQNTDAPFNVTVFAVDSTYALNSLANETVTLTTGDPYDTEPAPAALVNGQVTMEITPVARGTWTITPSGGPGPNIVSAPYTVGPKVQYEFEFNTEGWVFSGAILPFIAPSSSVQTDRIGLIINNNTSTFGFWQSPVDDVDVIGDSLYRARFMVSTNITDRSLVPNIRCRMNSQNFQQSSFIQADSNLDGAYSPTVTPSPYDLYFVPPHSAIGQSEDKDDLFFTLDVLNFNPLDAGSGVIYLDALIVDRIPMAALTGETTVVTQTFNASAEGWMYSGQVLPFTAPSSSRTGGTLTMTASNNTNTFGFWTTPVDAITIEGDRLYCAEFDLRTNVADQAQVPELRLRFITETSQASSALDISSADDGAMSPLTSTNTTYQLFIYPPQGAIGSGQDGMAAAFDMLNFAGDQATGSLILDEVRIKTFDVPGIP